MRNLLAAFATVTALTFAGSAFAAAPVQLTDQQMDMVTAGYHFGGGTFAGAGGGGAAQGNVGSGVLTVSYAHADRHDQTAFSGTIAVGIGRNSAASASSYAFAGSTSGGRH